MSWECRYLMNDHCERRDKPCDPGAPGCVLQGKYHFPFDDNKNARSKRIKDSSENPAPRSGHKPA